MTEYVGNMRPLRPQITSDFGPKAVRAAKALEGLNRDLFSLHSECINVSGAPEKIRANVVYQVLDSSGWNRTKLIESTRQASRILSRCGIYFNDIEVAMIAPDESYTKVNSVEYYQLVSATRIRAYPYLYFLKHQALKDKSIAGMAHIEGRYNASPGKRWHREAVDMFERQKTDWFSNVALVIEHKRNKSDSRYESHTRRLGVTIAHELYHLYGNCTCHSEDPANFMASTGGNFDKEDITPEQCETAVEGVRRINEYEVKRLLAL